MAYKQTTNWDLAKHEQTTLANPLNGFYATVQLLYHIPVDAADDNDEDGDVAVGDAGEADGGTIFSSCLKLHEIAWDFIHFFQI